METIKEEIEIKGEYPEWKINFKDRYCLIYIPTRMRPIEKDELKQYIKSSLCWALAMSWFGKKCGATHMDMKRIWEKFCLYNNWECLC